MDSDPSDSWHQAHVQCLAASYRHWLGEPLMPTADTTTPAFSHQLYQAPFAVLSHGCGTDPVFNYANRQAQCCFEMDWDQLTRLPSRLSAEADLRAERQRLLDAVRRRGFIDDYSGVRIARSGLRFRILDAVVWTLIDGQARPVGQAALFVDWRALD